MSVRSLAAHWQHTYHQQAPPTALIPAPISVALLAEAGLAHDAPILDVGCGVSAFLSELLAQGYRNLIATDVSATALAQHRRLLGVEKAASILWVEDDVTDPKRIAGLDPILLWHDQGLLQECTHLSQQTAYRQLLDHMLEPGGWALLAARAPAAAEQVPSHPLQGYDAPRLAAWLGSEYRLHQHQQHDYARLFAPPQPYTYALFQRALSAQQTFRQARVGR
ncbi:class I SAM-dependent methyltransferase [Hymenobacter profundi]|uniref:Class I SAM-dependent methyltransferase n=1 Tax=Hymenobacter profundi TaxID=1982110 RepID=A0ABS6X0Q6_9BACT|nr:class I SAM-dependent methyltransferase [Hymenobacter profundi]MBW3129423.1 class I SAM-dependent methyltransferase [Hymenobacter profundi]